MLEKGSLCGKQMVIDPVMHSNPKIKKYHVKINLPGRSNLDHTPRKLLGKKTIIKLGR